MDESKDPQGPGGLEGFIVVPERSPEYTTALIKAIIAMQAFKAKLRDHKPVTPAEVEAVLNENWAVYLYGMREGDINQAVSTNSFIISVIESLRERGYTIEFADNKHIVALKSKDMEGEG